MEPIPSKRRPRLNTKERNEAPLAPRVQARLRRSNAGPRLPSCHSLKGLHRPATISPFDWLATATAEPPRTAPQVLTTVASSWHGRDIHRFTCTTLAVPGLSDPRVLSGIYQNRNVGGPDARWFASRSATQQRELRGAGGARRHDRSWIFGGPRAAAVPCCSSTSCTPSGHADTLAIEITIAEARVRVSTVR